ncbi:MAG: glutamate synthase-related protein [Anaerolineales bacterium]
MKYERYRIPTASAPNVARHPSRFKVRVSRVHLARLLIRELIRYRGDLPLVLSRPCVYGVFSGPVGGFMPREQLCVGCLRCTVEHPQVVQIVPNPAHGKLGDSYFDSDKVATVLYEAATGRVPVRGAGYGGGFGGSGWDAMWTDMSEIVRPTRDGIHGRETISTAVDIGRIPRALEFDLAGDLINPLSPLVTLPIPILFDWMPDLVEERTALRALREAAGTLQTLMLEPLDMALQHDGTSAPLVSPAELDRLLEGGRSFPLIELDGWDSTAYQRLRSELPDTVVAVRLPLGQSPVDLAAHGVGVFHLAADYHGHGANQFALPAIRETHEQLVRAGLREQVTLIGSGGITAAEHVPKAIIAGLDAVAIDTALLVAWQARIVGESRRPGEGGFQLPAFDAGWGAQRIVNLIGSWRDQLLEVLGAMGLRELRRLRGELGRAMFQSDLEQEAFAGIEGFEHAAG